MILDEIIAHKRQEVSRQKSVIPLAELRAWLRDAPPVRGFGSALRKPDSTVAVVAEIKKASPSLGLIRFDCDPGRIAASYEQNGASALSVLTDRRFFCGCLADLRRARETSRLPVLRKDFIVDEYQLAEARVAGADAVLLILAALTRSDLKRLLDAAGKFGLDALVEVHDEVEMETAMASGARLVGVNNRDLRTFRVDMDATVRLSKLAGPSVTFVSESGIKSRDDLRALATMGVQAALVGESLMSAPDPGAKLREMLA